MTTIDPYRAAPWHDDRMVKLYDVLDGFPKAPPCECCDHRTRLSVCAGEPVDREAAELRIPEWARPLVLVESSLVRRGMAILVGEVRDAETDWHVHTRATAVIVELPLFVDAELVAEIEDVLRGVTDAEGDRP